MNGIAEGEAVRSNGKDLSIYQADATVGELKLWRAPEAVLAEAKQAADALQQVIAGSSIKPVKFGDKEHLLHEHWEILGHFFGYCTKVESTKYVEFPADGGNVCGFEASALLLNERTGAVVGRAEAMCLDEEEQWGEVAEYEWQDTFNAAGVKMGRAKVQVGTKPKPLFQIRSMAQTRASAKAFRTKLGWVAVLAGYSPTPAVEMQNSGDHSQEQARETPLPTKIERKAAPAKAPLTPEYPQARATAHVPQARQQQSEPLISEGQARRFYALWKQAGKNRNQVNEYLNSIGVSADADIPRSKYEAACVWAERPAR